MKKILLLVTAICIGFGAAAQYRPGYDPGYRPDYGPGYGPGYHTGHVYGSGYGYRGYMPDQRLEIGIGITGIGHGRTVQRDNFAELYGEWRGYLNDWFDVGAQLYFTGGRGLDIASSTDYNLFQAGWEGILDWNVYPMPNMTAFLGCGVGRTYGHYKGVGTDQKGWDRGWCIDPRIGVELFDRLRITAHLRGSFADQIGTYGAVSIGWCFNPFYRRHYRGQQPRDPSTLQPRIR